MRAKGLFLILICPVLGLYENADEYDLPQECSNLREQVSEKMIIERFFQPFNSWYRPTFNANVVVPVDVSFVLTSIVEIHERRRMMDITGYFVAKWMDEYRRWNETFPYNCVHYVVLPAEAIWLPDLAVINARSHYAITRLLHERARVYSNGYVSLTPGGSFSVYCNYDLSLFPFDVQTCPISVESWKYTTRYIRIVGSKDVTTIDYKEHQQWSLVDTFYKTSFLAYTEDWNQYDRVEFFLVIQRKTLYYIMNVILPSITIAVAHLATYTLPLAEVEKISISFTCILAYSVFKLMVMGDMPRSSDHVPILAAYIDIMMSYIALSMIGEGISFLSLRRISLEGKTMAVPKPLFKVCTVVGCMICIQPPMEATIKPVTMPTDSETNTEHVEFEHSPPNTSYVNIKSWRFVATVINRVVVTCYISCIVLTPLIMFAVIPNVRK